MRKHSAPPIFWSASSQGKPPALQRKAPHLAPPSSVKPLRNVGPPRVVQRFFRTPVMEVEMEDMATITQRQRAQPHHMVHGTGLRFKYAHTGTFSADRFITLVPNRSISANGHGQCRKYRVDVYHDDTLTGMHLIYEIQYYTDPNKFPIAFLMHIETKAHGYDDLKGVGALLVFAMCKEVSDRHVSEIQVCLPAADQRGFYAHMGFDTSVVGQAPGETLMIHQKSRVSASSHWVPA